MTRFRALRGAAGEDRSGRHRAASRPSQASDGWTHNATLYVVRALVAGVALSALLALAPRAARASPPPRFAIVRTGQAFFEAGPIDRLSLTDVGGAPDYRGAYRCDVLSLFGAYLFRTDCTPVIVFHDGGGQFHFDDGPAAQTRVGSQYALSDAPLDFWPAHGRWLFLGVFVLALVWTAISAHLRGGGPPPHRP